MSQSYDRPPRNTSLYLVRHCKAAGQEPDAPLTEQGTANAERLAGFLGNMGIESIVSSPFTRAVQSIQPLADQLHLEVQTDPRLQERVLSSTNYPDWRERLGQTFDQLDLSFSGGESSRQAMQRADAAIQDILRAHTGNTIVVVTHGNLAALILKSFDPSIGFATWENMTTPDVFRIEPSDTDDTISRIWQPSADE